MKELYCNKCQLFWSESAWNNNHGVCPGYNCDGRPFEGFYIPQQFLADIPPLTKVVQ